VSISIINDIDAVVVDLEPMAASRPRFSKYGTYNNSKYTNYKSAFLLKAKQQNKKFLTGALRLDVLFVMPIPKSWSKKKRLASVGQPHICKPDADNLVKAMLDALEGTIYKNDSQVYSINAKKIYGNNPRTIYILEEIKND